MTYIIASLTFCIFYINRSDGGTIANMPVWPFLIPAREGECCSKFENGKAKFLISCFNLKFCHHINIQYCPQRT